MPEVGRSWIATSASSCAAPVSSSSSCSSNCSIWRLIRSDDRPNCIRRSLAIWNLSFSISSVLYCTEICATFSSLWQASAKARSSAGSVGSSAVASDMRKSTKLIPPHQNRYRIADLSDQHWLARRRRGYPAAPVHRLHQHRHLRRRQRHPAVHDRRPHETPLLERLGEQPTPRAIPVNRLKVVTPLAAENK